MSSPATSHDVKHAVGVLTESTRESTREETFDVPSTTIVDQLFCEDMTGAALQDEYDDDLEAAFSAGMADVSSKAQTTKESPQESSGPDLIGLMGSAVDVVAKGEAFDMPISGGQATSADITSLDDLCMRKDKQSVARGSDGRSRAAQGPYFSSPDLVEEALRSRQEADTASPAAGAFSDPQPAAASLSKACASKRKVASDADVPLAKAFGKPEDSEDKNDTDVTAAEKAPDTISDVAKLSDDGSEPTAALEAAGSGRGDVCKPSDFTADARALALARGDMTGGCVLELDEPEEVAFVAGMAVTSAPARTDTKAQAGGQQALTTNDGPQENKGPDLIALMSSAVDVVERGEEFDMPISNVQATSIELSDVGAASEHRETHGSVGGGDGRPRTAQGQYFGSPDPVEEALKKSRQEADSGPPVGGTLSDPPPTLASLRKAYDWRGVPASSTDSPPSEVVEKTQEDKHDADADAAAAEEEWERVAATTEELKKNKQENAKSHENALEFKPITYKEVKMWLKDTRVDDSIIEPLREKKTASRGFCLCSGRPKRMLDVPGLSLRLNDDKLIFVQLKLTHFDFNDLWHWRMLRTIYTKVTRSQVCASVGGHWEQIGFQGGDPRTDLNRHGGVLNVLHMFYFFAHYSELFKAAYELAKPGSEQEFPLGAVSINITKMVYEHFLNGRFSKLCNANGCVVETSCKIYTAGLYYYYKRWKTRKRTIRDNEQTMKEVNALMAKPDKLLAELEAGEQERKTKTDASRLQFTDLEFGAARAKPAQQAQSTARLDQYKA